MKKHLLFLVMLFIATAGAWAATITVGPGGPPTYDYATIQAAVNASVPGGIINVAPGTYIESNILVDKSLTIQGVGATRDVVIVVPAAYDGHLDNAFTSAQNCFIIKANSVTIKKLTINGNGNPALTSPTNNYRAGIVTLDASQSGGGTWNYLHVDNVVIKNVYRRGISVFPRAVVGTFVENSWIENVAYNQGMYLAGQSQVTNNTVKHCFQGIVLNPDNTTPSAASFKINGNTLTEIGNFVGCFGYPNGQPRAIQFDPVDPVFKTVEIKDNVINDNGSIGNIGTVGIYTRRASSTSLIENNTITLTSGTTHSTGAQAVGMILGWSYANGFTARINHINVSGYGLGILVFGTGTSAYPMILEGNVLTASGSLRTEAGDGTGIYVANQYLYGASNKTESYVIIQNQNNISGFVRGIDVEKIVTSTQPITVIANNNIISGNTTGSDASTLTAPIDITNNYWGNSNGPYHALLNPAGSGNAVSNNETFIPWWCSAAMTSKCSPISGTGFAIMNLTTGTKYTTAQLGAALTAALTGETLFISGTVDALNVNIPGKVVTIVGTGIAGESVISGALTLSGGGLIIRDITFANTTDASTVLVTSGTLKLRNCVINETSGGTRAGLEVTGGTVDAGTTADHGLNKFVVSSPGSAISNAPATTLYAIGNNWGSPTGPTIDTNPSGTGGAIIGANKAFVLYDPWGGISLTGNLTYYNAANTPLTSSVTVKLYQNDNQIGSDYVVSAGTYTFANLVKGDYEIRTTSTKSTAGSVNATDAAQVNYWGAHPYEIEKVRFYAGDVTGETHYINATDAQRIQKNFVYGTAFDRPSWTFWEINKTITSNSSPAESYPIVTIAGLDKTANLYGLCTGDFNRSFTPAKKSTSSDLILNYAGTIQVSANQEFDLPIRIENASKVGAVSLIFSFPVDFMEVMDVQVNGISGQLDWNVKGNELRIGWNSSVPSNLAALDNLLTLHLKTTDAFKKGNSIRIALVSDPLNELANELYDVIPNSVLNVDVVEASAYGVDEHSAGNGISMYNYPNPFASSTTIAYTLPFTGNVILEIHNLLGNTLTTLVNEIQTQGNHSFRFNASALAPGVYTATIRLSNKSDEAVKTVKIVISR